ncbi:MAG: hypothetical protein K0Q87_4368 [Neobacillus sp.]|nr:hypothetical protein [Neobacillus sp.]
MKETKKLLEVDLYKPIQTFFSREGYEVYGEVKDCDLVAVKDEELVVVELKLTLSVDLLIQAAKRQRITDQVYIAIPKPKQRLRSKAWTDKCHLVRRLELGLIIVSFSGGRAKSEVVFHPTPFNRKKNCGQSKLKRKAIMNEITGRSADFNVGNCIQIACFLEREGPLSPKLLKNMGTGDKTSSILTKNYYGWFERIKRGTYALTEKGRHEINDSPELVKYYQEKQTDR